MWQAIKTIFLNMLGGGTHRGDLTWHPSKNRAPVEEDAQVVEVRIGEALPTQDTSAPTAAISGARYRFEYTDADGVITHREATFLRMDGPWAAIFMCHTRGANRTFRFDRMRNIVRVADGASIPLGAFLNHLAQTAQHDKEATGEAWETYSNALLLLAYIAKIDNRFVQREKQFIANFLLARDQPQSVVDALLKKLSRQITPTVAQVDALLNCIIVESSADARAALWKACQGMAMADGKMQPEEATLLDRIEDALVS